MHLCRDIIGRQCCATSGSAGTSWNRQGRESSIVADIRDPIGDTGKGGRETVQESWRNKTTETTRDLVADNEVTLVGEM